MFLANLKQAWSGGVSASPVMLTKRLDHGIFNATLRTSQILRRYIPIQHRCERPLLRKDHLDIKLSRLTHEFRHCTDPAPCSMLVWVVLQNSVVDMRGQASVMKARVTWYMVVTIVPPISTGHVRRASAKDRKI